MNPSSTHAADTRAAQAALTRPLVQDFDRYLLIDDSDDDMTLILTVLSERICPVRDLEVRS
jgi:hypothetical protein